MLSTPTQYEHCYKLSDRVYNGVNSHRGCTLMSTPTQIYNVINSHTDRIYNVQYSQLPGCKTLSTPTQVVHCYKFPNRMYNVISSDTDKIYTVVNSYKRCTMYNVIDYNLESTLLSTPTQDVKCCQFTHRQAVHCWQLIHRMYNVVDSHLESTLL